VERTVSTVGFSLGNDYLTDLDYADDDVLLAHATDDLYGCLRALPVDGITARPANVRTEDKSTKPGCW